MGGGAGAGSALCGDTSDVNRLEGPTSLIGIDTIHNPPEDFLIAIDGSSHVVAFKILLSIVSVLFVLLKEYSSRAV